MAKVVASTPHRARMHAINHTYYMSRFERLLLCTLKLTQGSLMAMILITMMG